MADNGKKGITPQRVLMTADSIGGVWTYSLELAGVLSSRGIEVALAVMGAPLSKAQRQEAARIKGVKLYESVFRLEWMKDPWEEVKAAGKWLLAIESSEKPDIIHLNNYAHASMRWRAPVLVTAHSCVVSWWNAVRKERLPDEWDEYRQAVEQGLNNADAVVAPTNAMLATLYENYSFNTPCRVVPNCRDFSLFTPGRKENIIFTAGRLWDEAKNFKALFSIAAGLYWPLHAAGETHGPFGAPQACGNAICLGRLGQEELASWLSRASIYALPALYEPFGLSVLEAALSGCALVLGDIKPLRENWDGAAVFVRPDDPRSIKEAINALITDEAGLERMSRLALSRAKEFSSERTAGGYLSIYRELLRKRSEKYPIQARGEAACGY